MGETWVKTKLTRQRRRVGWCKWCAVEKTVERMRLARLMKQGGMQAAKGATQTNVNTNFDETNRKVD